MPGEIPFKMRMTMIRKIYLFAFIASFFAVVSNSQAQINLSVNGSQTPQQLVQNVLLGPGVIATNITYNGAPNAIGFFNGVGSNLGLDSGIVLTCGDIANAPGPNNLTGASTANGLPGDPDLDNIMSPTQSYDATILEFDFVATGDSVKFNYVFGSEEYMEYVSTTPGGINDGFGFFLSGVTTPMPATNIALIPSTTTPVTIFNVNCLNGSPYYVCNDPNNSQCATSYNCPGSSNGTTVQYDGFTTVLTAAAQVICGETYHIKIAIADGADQVLDSGVFLEAGSFQASQVTISANISYGGPNDSTLFEGCGQACLIFDRGQGNLNNPDTVALSFSGSATVGADITGLPPQLIFPAGEDSIIVCVQAVADNTTEGLENLIVTAQSVGGPCPLLASSFQLFIGDYVPVSVTASGNSPICPGGNAILNSNITGGVEPYAYSWSNGGTDSSAYVTPSSTTTYTLTVTDACNNTATSNFQVVVNQPLQLSIEDQTVCLGNSITITPNITGGAPAFYYIWQNLSGPDTLVTSPAGTATLTPTANGTYQLTLWDNCNTSVTDQFAINVQEACEIYVPNVFSPNGDNANESFVVKNLEKFPNSELLVYNRWGSKVFESSNYQNDWNGNGVAEGVYYYVLNVSDGKMYRGFVTILR